MVFLPNEYSNSSEYLYIQAPWGKKWCQNEYYAKKNFPMSTICRLIMQINHKYTMHDGISSKLIANQ